MNAVVVAAEEVLALEDVPDARRLVNVCRRWSEAADECLLNEEVGFSEDLVAVARRLPSMLCSLTVTTVVLHEELIVAFEYSLRINQAALPQDHSYLDDVLGRLEHVLHNPPEVLTVLELKRLETLCEFLRLSLTHFSEHASLSLADSFISGVREIQQRVLGCQGSPSFTRDFRSQASSLRRICINLSVSLFGTFPDWVNSNPEAFMDLALRSLGSPLLLSAGLACFPPNTVPSNIAEIIVAHLRKGVIDLGKYQSAAVRDLLTSIGDIAAMEHGLPLLLSDDGLLIRSLAEMYNEMPKAADRKADYVKEWKVQLMECFDKILRRVQATEGSLKITESFEINAAALIIVKGVASDLTSIKLYLGNSSSTSSDMLLADEASLLSSLGHASSLTGIMGKVSAESLSELLHACTCFLVTFAESFSSLNSKDFSNSNYISLFAVVLVVIKEKLSREVVFDDEVIQLLSEVDLFINVCILLLKCGRFTADSFKSQLLFLAHLNDTSPAFATIQEQIQSTVREALEKRLFRHSDIAALEFREALAFYADALAEVLT